MKFIKAWKRLPTTTDRLYLKIYSPKDGKPFFKTIGCYDDKCGHFVDLEDAMPYKPEFVEWLEEEENAKQGDIMIPRRMRLDLSEPAELAIRSAVDEVEKIGADIRLSRAVVLLDEARTLVADFIDEQQSDKQFEIYKKEKEEDENDLWKEVEELCFCESGEPLSNILKSKYVITKKQNKEQEDERSVATEDAK